MAYLIIPRAGWRILVLVSALPMILTFIATWVCCNYFIVCPIHVHGVGQTKFSVDSYVRTCVCTCVHALDRIEVSAPGAPRILAGWPWPAGLVANCEQQDWRAVRSSRIGILHRTIKFSRPTVYCNRIGQTPCSTEHSLSCCTSNILHFYWVAHYIHWYSSAHWLFICLSNFDNCSG